MKVTTLAERPWLAEAPLVQPFKWPEFMLQGNDKPSAIADGLHLPFSVVATESEGVVARASAVPFSASGPDRQELPDRGWYQVLQWAAEDAREGTAVDTIAFISVTVSAERRGAGLAGRMLEKLKELARLQGLKTAVVPVRPEGKAQEPSVPMSEYAARVRDDGLPCDSWLRTHVRAGGKIIGVAPAAMTISGSLAQWRRWTGLPFTTEGPTEVPRALAPVYCSLSQQHAVYVEPNVWVRYDLA
ncbi:N-acetyltransferase [Streptomyces sp. 3N207]|uniref:N-acetyltransferase n=1 Tax=Streptomyces sp. 3N207 TaxID=3457417 RepID=UPI003FD4D0B3